MGWAASLVIAGLLLMVLSSGAVSAQAPDPPGSGCEKQYDRAATLSPRGNAGCTVLLIPVEKKISLFDLSIHTCLGESCQPMVPGLALKGSLRLSLGCGDKIDPLCLRINVLRVI